MSSSEDSNQVPGGGDVGRSDDSAAATPRPRPRRPQPDRDSFIERHGRGNGSKSQAADAESFPVDEQAPVADAPESTTRIESSAASPADDNDTGVMDRVDDGPDDWGSATDTGAGEAGGAEAGGARPLGQSPAHQTPADDPPADAPQADDSSAGEPTQAFAAPVTESPKAYSEVGEPPEGASARLPRSSVPVQSSDEPVHTEPFENPDDERDRPRGERRTAEHLTQEPLPYIDPDETQTLDESEYASEPFDDEPEAVQPAAAVAPEAPRARRGTVDLGLLILRLALGAVFTLHGLQKLTGWLNGPGPDGFADFLANSADPSLGFNSDVTKILSLVAGVSETAGGILLILGLFTPIAGAAVLGTILVAMTYKATLAGGLWFFVADGNGNGIEYEAMLAAAAAALILTGPGLYSFDRRWGWARRPAWGSGFWVLVGIGAAIAVWVVFNGTNPLVNS
ncbi:DoxX family protein [Gordonia zhaorongruii]|uniref:DoxX family protein n=1 Tax=Gordonia zhaorongruii TaxID=2597659 RepID=UPI001FD070D7|nr:DoxX family protein [Gordonia zhaorongruii]